VPGIGNAKAGGASIGSGIRKYELVGDILKSAVGSVVPPFAWNALSIGSQTCPSLAEHDSVRFVGRSWSNVWSSPVKERSGKTRRSESESRLAGNGPIGNNHIVAGAERDGRQNEFKSSIGDPSPKRRLRRNDRSEDQSKSQPKSRKTHAHHFQIVCNRLLSKRPDVVR